MQSFGVAEAVTRSPLRLRKSGQEFGIGPGCQRWLAYSSRRTHGIFNVCQLMPADGKPVYRPSEGRHTH